VDATRVPGDGRVFSKGYGDSVGEHACRAGGRTGVQDYVCHFPCLAVTFAGMEDELEVDQLEFESAPTHDDTSGIHRLEHRIPVVSCGGPA
jgi:hypothetical protein